jgi:indole-3-glycerol phosphate synthase
MSNLLDEIVANKRLEIEALKREKPLAEIEHQARNSPKDRRPFRARFETGPVLIAEIKPKSPSAGELIPTSPYTIADLYAKSNADVISVLTDEKYFGGTIGLLKSVRETVPQTVLRKEFVIEPYQVYETAVIGADAFLLIASVLSREALASLRQLGESLGLDALVEVHDEDDLEKALSSGARVIGINNRDLKTLNIDLSTTERLIKQIPDDIPVVSESGIETVEDVKRVRAAGARGILVGTSILRSGDVVHTIAEFKKALYV